MISLPSEIWNQIADYMWGSTNDWRKRLNISHILPRYTSHFETLLDVENYRLRGTNIWAEDSLYCPCCGEKRLFFAFTFTRSQCEWCLVGE